MYELIILVLLARAPTHGYLLSKIINDMLGPFAKVSNGTLYPLLNKMERAAWIKVVEEEDKKQTSRDHHGRTFTITEKGWRRFHQLLMDTSSNQGDYQRIFHCKVPCLYWLKPDERLYLLRHYINYCQAQILYFNAEAEDFIHVYDPRSHSRFVESTLDTMRHRAQQWEMELEWVMQVQAREIAYIEQEGATS